MSGIICKSKGLGSIKMRQITDNDLGKIWLSDEYNYGDWPFYFAIRLEYTGAKSKEWEADAGPYHIELCAVSPVAAADLGLPSVAASIGMPVEEFKAGPIESQCEELINGGIAARFASYAGKNLAKMMLEAKKKFPEINFMFGAWMDHHQNAIGDTGWDWIQGDIGASSRRRRAK